MRGLTPIPTRARRSTWRRVRANLVLHGLATRPQPDPSALPRGRLLAGELSLVLPNDECFLLVPLTEPDGSLHGKTLGSLVSDRWRTAERLGSTTSSPPRRVSDRIPARVLLRDVRRRPGQETSGRPDWPSPGMGDGVLEPDTDLVISPHDDLTVTMYDCLRETLRRTCPIVDVTAVLAYLGRFAEPVDWPGWIPNDEAAPLPAAPAIPAGVDRDIWDGIAGILIDTFSLEGDQARFDVTVESLQGDSLDAVRVFMDLEERLGVAFDDDEAEALFASGRTLGDLYHAVLAKRRAGH